MSDGNDLIEAIQTSGHKASLVMTGGGSGAAHAILSHPGASRFVLEVQVPYCSRAMVDYLGEEVEQACLEETAIIMAGRAFERALIFSLAEENPFPVLGIACTAALQTNRERKGKDRAHICIKARNNQYVRTIDFKEGSRSMQEELLTAELLKSIAEFLGIQNQ